MSIKDYFMKPMGFPFDFSEWKMLPFEKRAQKLCEVWADQGFGAPVFVYFFYLAKTAFYIYMWFFFCSFSTNLGDMSSVGAWWFKIESIYKAVFWTMLIEGTGFGGASGPLTARYVPPFGGITYFLRPGTIKIPMFPNTPLIGGDKRNILDIILYVGYVALLVMICVSPVINWELVLAVIILLPVLGILDRTIYLSSRADMYFPAAFCFLFPLDQIAALKLVWFGIWFWAAFSKLTPNFTSVVCVMICNSPVLGFDFIKRKLFKNYPDDLRPGLIAGFMSHFGTVVEFALPIILITSGNPTLTMFALVGMLCFHSFIVFNVPMGVPIEWNFIMVYGGFLLFGHFAEVSVFSISSPLLLSVFAIALFILPILGNFYPRHVSFLMSMRYYAGTWPYSVWLFKGNSVDKIDENMVKTSPALMKQLGMFYDQITIESVLSRMIAFRMMHLPGRTLHNLLPKTVDNINEYTWYDGESIAGEVVGWNFGDGHLHSEALLGSIQKRCHYESGELRCIFVESPTLVRQEMSWRIYDAKDGLIEKGITSIYDLKNNMPWPTK